MAENALRLSLVIPVYNEEHHIKGCLEAVAKQTVSPYEVIVVDNNCTDSTIALAREFPFVTVVAQPRQGRGWARSAGFDAARGELIGRIDADSRIAADWVARATADFVADPELYGVTGIGKTALIPRIKGLKGTFWSRAYYWFVHASFHTITLWGADMAIRRTAWEAVRNSVCNDDSLVHEDQDISVEIAARGMKLLQDNHLRIETGGQSYNYLPKLYHYSRLEKSTLRLHRAKGTLTSPKLRRLSFLNTLPGQIYAFVPGLCMVIASVLWYPIDAIMIKRGKAKTWLD